jgi:hypothetical protein
MLAVMAGGAALSLVWPFAIDIPGATRATTGALGSALVFCIVRQGMEMLEKLRRYRAGLPIDPGYMRGLEPGARTVTLTLDGLREHGPFGTRVFAWRDISDVVEDEHLAALIISPTECVVIPKWVLARAGHGDLEVIGALVRQAHAN